MSNTTNDRLLERARDAAEYWVGTQWEKEIEAALERHDLEELNRIVAAAESEASIQEFYGSGVFDVY